MLNRNDIMKIIPHRPPFLLVDEITLLEPGVRAEGLLHLNGQEWFFPGHFPGQPIFPGVLMVEALAQVGAACVLSLPEYRGKIGLFASIKDARFKHMVVPNDTLHLSINIDKVRFHVGHGTGFATVRGEVAVKCKLSFAISDAVVPSS